MRHREAKEKKNAHVRLLAGISSISNFPLLNVCERVYEVQCHALHIDLQIRTRALHSLSAHPFSNFLSARKFALVSRGSQRKCKLRSAGAVVMGDGCAMRAGSYAPHYTLGRVLENVIAFTPAVEHLLHPRHFASDKRQTMRDCLTRPRPPNSRSANEKLIDEIDLINVGFKQLHGCSHTHKHKHTHTHHIDDTTFAINSSVNFHSTCRLPTPIIASSLVKGSEVFGRFCNVV